MERTKLPQNDHSLELYSSSAFLVINKKLLQYFGPNTAVYLSNLIDKYKYFKERNHIKEGDWFCVSQEAQMEQTGLTLSKLRTCKTELKELNILTTKLMGNPAKEYYKLNLLCLPDLVRRTETSPQDVRKPDGSYSGLYNNPSHIRKTIPPPIESVIQYCKERKNNVDPYMFHDFYTTKNWMIGKNKMVDWQAAIRTWERKDSQEGNKNKPKHVSYDGMKYYLGPDGKYRNKSGAIYIE